MESKYIDITGSNIRTSREAEERKRQEEEQTCKGFLIESGKVEKLRPIELNLLSVGSLIE